VADYLPLSAFRQDLLPEECRGCVWWLADSGESSSGQHPARRHCWMAQVEADWGTTGLMLQRASSRSGPPALSAIIQFAPAAALCRLHDLPLAPIPPDAAVLMCLRSDDDCSSGDRKGLLHKALSLLKDRGALEAFAISSTLDGSADEDACRFFALEFLEANGFAVVANYGDLRLCRVDLRGLLSRLPGVEALVKCVLRVQPSLNPAPQ